MTESNTEYSIAQQEAQATAKLNTAQNDFKKLQEDEEKYLTEREARAEAKLEVQEKAIGNAERILDTVIKEIKEKWEQCFEKLKGLAEKMNSLADRIDNITESADNLKETSEKLLKEANKRIAEVDKATTRMSQWEKDLKGREDEVTEKHTDAKKKLKEAEDLAYWHTEGKRYTHKK
jgi:chromosome segregation ATPase